MASYKRQDELIEIKLIAALLHDIHMSHGAVFNTRALRLTLKKVSARVRSEGIGFLTKTLPKLGKTFDKVLSGQAILNSATHGFATMRGSELPQFCGEFFSKVCSPTGTVLPDPCAESVRILRQILYLWYKYELPYTDEQETAVISSFEKTEDDLGKLSSMFATLSQATDDLTLPNDRWYNPPDTQAKVAWNARKLLTQVLSGVDLTDIVPRHGPGAVATRQQLWEKYEWTNVSSRIRSCFPVDAFFYASLGHVCDSVTEIQNLGELDLPARVVLVPKDSRGPRLISCEPVDYQWIQQGISRELVNHLESYRLTMYSLHFTDQLPNRFGALLGSKTGRYATLDLKEASDRISTDLVRLLFPAHVTNVLESARSSSTVLPSGKVLQLRKFAPMGSALCFPVMALTVWAILTAAAPDADTKDSILVYGDDVIVPTAYAENAMQQLESFGLLINRDKSCIKGLFRESCGMDAFKGVCVTPVRFRTVWSNHPSADAYTSWIAYANSMFDRKYFSVYDLIVEMLYHYYGEIPDDGMQLACPSLREVPEYMRPKRSKTNRGLQKRQWRVLDVKAPIVSHTLPGWSMLLRFFTEASGNAAPQSQDFVSYESRLWYAGRFMGAPFKAPFSVGSYTRRRASMLARRWR